MKLIWTNTDELTLYNDNVVLVVKADDLSLQKSVQICNIINNCKQTGNTVALVLPTGDAKHKNCELTILTMIKNGYYSIMEVDDLADIDGDYAESVLEYEVDLDELQAILGPTFGKFAYQLKTDSNNPLNVLIQNLIDTTVKATEGGLQADIDEHGENDKLRADLLANKQELNNIHAKVVKLNQCVEEQAQTIRQLNATNQTLTLQLDSANSRIEQLTTNVSLSGGNAIQYVTLNLDKFITSKKLAHTRCDNEYVIYMKEISPCSYINSFVKNFMQFIKLNKHKSIICLIYDDTQLTTIKYGKLPVLTGTNFVPDSSLKDQQFVVVAEPAQQILEQALITNEIVIVYDRLHESDDIISGKAATKFVVVNGQKELLEAKKATKLPSEQFITTFGTDKDTLSIRAIREYKQMSSGGQLLSYANMLCTQNETETIFDAFIFAAKIVFDPLKITP